MRAWVRVLLTVVVASAIGLGALITMVIVAFAVPSDRALPVVVGAAAFGLILLCAKGIWSIERRWFTWAIAGYFAVVVVGSAVYEIPRAIDAAVPTLSEGQVNLEEYLPFASGTRAASLDGESTLKLDDPPFIDGSTALYPLYAAFARATFPEREYPLHSSESQVRCTTTSTAYERLLKGDTDIIFVSPPSKEHLDAAAKMGEEFVLTPIGREAFVFFVNARNPVDGLTAEQIRAIYSGELTDWRDLGGESGRIIAFQRSTNSGSQTMLERMMGDRPLMTPPSDEVVDVMAGMFSRTSNYKNYRNAIGYSFLYYATSMVESDQIKLLTVDGASPNSDTIASGEYPLASEFYAVTLKNPPENAKKLAEWAASPQGQELVEKTGYVRLK